MLKIVLIGATFVVNSSVDEPDINPGDGICETSSGYCSLRAATDEANLLVGYDTVTFAVNSVLVDSSIYVSDSLYLSGNVTVDSIFCGFGADCIFATSYLEVRNIYIRSGKTGISSRYHLKARNLYIVADTFAVYSYGGKVEIRNSELTSPYWGIASYYDTLVVVRNTSISGGSVGIEYYSDGDEAPDSVLNNTIVSDGICLRFVMNGKNTYVRNNTFQCTGQGIGIYDEEVNPAVPESVFVEYNDFYIYGRGATAISVSGCNRCSIGSNTLLGTDTSGYFIYLSRVNNSDIWSNTNMNSTPYTDAGRYMAITLESSDSNRVRLNRWAFSYLKDSTGGIQLLYGSDYNRVDSNYVASFVWGGLVVYDSSSYNTFYLDSLVNTAGIQVRRHWMGRYSFPFNIDTLYSGPVGRGNLFRKVYSLGLYMAMLVVGMDSTVVDSSYLEVGDLWDIVMTNAGSRVFVDNTVLKGASTSTDIGGYGISLEYFYGSKALASEYADDSLFEIHVTNSVFQDLMYQFRVMDMDTSYIKLDTIFSAANNNLITGNTYGYYGEYYLPVVVQTLDLDCNASILAIDSVRIADAWGAYTTLDKLNTTDALWSFHWEPVSTVYYDSLHMWYPLAVYLYDDAGNLSTYNPFTVTLYGENGRTLSYSLNVERGLVNYTDPCPASGYPKTVDSRWLVIKIQYDPGYLPVASPEEKQYRITIGRFQVPVSFGETVRVFSPSGRLVKSLRVQGNAHIELPSGIYLLRVSDRVYRVPVF